MTKHIWDVPRAGDIQNNEFVAIGVASAEMNALLIFVLYSSRADVEVGADGAEATVRADATDVLEPVSSLADLPLCSANGRRSATASPRSTHTWLCRGRGGRTPKEQFAATSDLHAFGRVE